MPRQARIDACPPRLSSQWRAGAWYLASYHMQGYRATKPVSGKTRFCFAKDLHSLLRLGADSSKEPIAKIRA
ncbi:MAG: hypothetical protein MUO43_01980 [Desulfobacterales bacterium]|nr:hypothetical protein [Desulfobacterales bacterium]